MCQLKFDKARKISTNLKNNGKFVEITDQDLNV